MAAPPTLSPWPAPTLAAAAPVPQPEPLQGVAAPPAARQLISTLLLTAKRLTSRSERAEHAAVKVEQRLHQELLDLPSDWHLVPAADIGRHDRSADHVVIGPGGVFSLYVEHVDEAKVWINTHQVTIDGRPTEHLRHARFQARHAGGLLTAACGFDVTVQSVLVLVGVATMQAISRPAEVHVRDQHDLRDWLCRQPHRLDSRMVTAIHTEVRSGAIGRGDEAGSPADQWCELAPRSA